MLEERIFRMDRKKLLFGIGGGIVGGVVGWFIAPFISLYIIGFVFESIDQLMWLFRKSTIVGGVNLLIILGIGLYVFRIIFVVIGILVGFLIYRKISKKNLLQV